MENFSLISLIGLFLILSAVIWVAGVTLTKTSDTLDTRFKLGEAFGGMILLGIAGTLPEIAIIISASLAGRYDVVVGNLIGGIAVQTLVIVICDFAIKGKRPLSYHAGSKVLSYEGLFVAILTFIALIGMKINWGMGQLQLSPISIILAVGWIYGLYLINKIRKRIELYDAAEGSEPGRMHHEKRAAENHPFFAGISTGRVVRIFLIASVVTLIAGVLIEKVSSGIASGLGLSTGLFAGTILALVASLPEISSSLESIAIGDNQLAISEIFGGNALMPALFIVGDLIAGHPILPFAKTSDIIFAILGVTMTLIYTISLFRRPKRRYFRLGVDSILAVAVYIVGIVILSFIG